MDYVKVGTLEELADKICKVVKLLGRSVAIVRLGDSLLAIEACCKHQGADLLANYHGGETVVCPRHKWRYNLRSGRCLDHDTVPLRKYHVKVENEMVLVSLLPYDGDDSASQ